MLTHSKQQHLSLSGMYDIYIDISLSVFLFDFLSLTQQCSLLWAISLQISCGKTGPFRNNIHFTGHMKVFLPLEALNCDFDLPFWTTFALLHSSFPWNLWENNFHFKKKERKTFPLFFVDQYLCNILTTPERIRRLVWTSWSREKIADICIYPLDPLIKVNTFQEVPRVEWITGDQWNETKQVTACITTRSHFLVTFSRLVGTPWSHMLMHFSILWRAIIVKRGILIQKTLLLNSIWVVTQGTTFPAFSGKVIQIVWTDLLVLKKDTFPHEYCRYVVI